MKNNLTKYRELANLSMRQLAFKSGMSAMQISRLESGENQFTHKNLIKLSNALEIKPEDLIKEINIECDEIIHLNFYTNIFNLINCKSAKIVKEKLPVLKSTLDYMKIFDSGETIAFKVEEDLSENLVKLGDILFIDISINNINSNTGIYSFIYDDTFYIKRIQKIPNKLIITSNNDVDKYSNWEILLPSNKIKIIGKVRGKISIDKY